MSKLHQLPKISTSYRKGSWDNNEIYNQLISTVYCATYCCGTSIQHLTPSEDVHSIITSLMRFHLYFTVRRLLRRIQGGEKCQIYEMNSTLVKYIKIMKILEEG